VLWKWDGTDPAPVFQVGGTARVLASQDRILIISDGIDPQVFIPDIGGEVFSRPVELDLTLQITASVEFNGRIIPLGDLSKAYASLDIERASFRDEMASVRRELAQRLLGVDELNGKVDGIVPVVRRLSSDLENLLTEELGKVNSEVKEHLNSAIARVHSELEMLRKTDTAFRKDRAETTEWLRAELESLRVGALAANTEITELRNKLETEKKGRKNLEESWSWRVTAPARFFLGRLVRNRES
jgi:hypothetical protein